MTQRTSTQRIHYMPFGTRITGEGVRFRLWAPGCAAVGLCLEDEPPLPMNVLSDGWFELTTQRAGAGTNYRFEVSDNLRVPDPASRWNPDDVHGASQVFDPAAFDWQDANWHGRPWHEAVVYELHVGTFSPEGTFAGAARRLDYLLDLGVTAIELMPVADFPGGRDWGYDGVLPFAPDSRYGRPEDLKALIQAAHARGIMVLLDVVYNHFGPEGNYLHVYASPFFDEAHATPWGAAIDFAGAAQVREFFVHNALYWLEEYHLDGLRLDAVHAIHDASARHILAEIAERAREGATGDMPHLILENDANQARHLGSGAYTAQWNDDLHHALHVLLTGEGDGYYADYADQPIRHLGRCLAEGYAYQGEVSAYRDRKPRGEASAHLPPRAFVAFLQSHDQVGNRALGERIGHLAPAPAVRAAAAIVLLAPSIPMLFMGEEFGAATPFQFFCDFGADLREAVTEGRRREFAGFARFADPAARAAIPDPNRVETFNDSRLDWGSIEASPQREWLAYYRALLRIRQELIVPRLVGMPGGAAGYEVLPPAGLRVRWRLGDDATLWLLANLSDQPTEAGAPAGALVFATSSEVANGALVFTTSSEVANGALVFTTSSEVANGALGPWSVVWTLEEGGEGR